MKAFEVTPRLLRPLPASLRGMACSHCLKPQARWGFGPSDMSDVDAVCAVCYLYKSPWGLNNETEIADVVQRVETEKKMEFERDESGRLSKVEDCDRFLAAFATEMRLTGTMARMKEVAR